MAVPKISIVTPSFNQAQFLEKTICSVLDQGYENLEYIVVDGGSSDGSAEIIRQYEQHLHYWCSEEDEGQYHAINKGFRQASGEIFAWINSDDAYQPGALEMVAEIFTEHPDIRWLTTLRQLGMNAEGIQKEYSRMPGYSRQAFLDGLYLQQKGYWLGYIQQESTFWSRSLWEQAGGLDTQYELAADFDLWGKFFLLDKLHGVDACIASFRMHDQNRSLDRKSYLHEAKASLALIRERAKWSGAPATLAILDQISRLPKARSLLQRVMVGVAGRYSAPIIARAAESRGGPWERRNTRF